MACGLLFAQALRLCEIKTRSRRLRAESHSKNAPEARACDYGFLYKVFVIRSHTIHTHCLHR